MFPSPRPDQGYYLMTPGSIKPSFIISKLYGTEMYECKRGTTGMTLCVEFKEYVFPMVCLGEAWGRIMDVGSVLCGMERSWTLSYNGSVAFHVSEHAEHEHAYIHGACLYSLEYKHHEKKDFCLFACCYFLFLEQ